MDNPIDPSLEARIKRLETTVSALEKKLEATSEESTPSPISATASEPEASEPEPSVAPTPASAAPPPLPPEPPQQPLAVPKNIKTSEYWLNKIGMGLVLLGLIFFFKYSIDQGWITPHVRIGCGILLAIGFLMSGLRISKTRKHLGHVLMGGGMATFYITGFSAFQLFHLVSHVTASAAMVCVTLSAFILSLRKNSRTLALIGFIGGLSTPFFLYDDVNNLAALVAYTCLLLTGASALYYYRGWTSLLWSSFIGSWLVLAIALTQGLCTDLTASSYWVLQGGILYASLAFGIIPLARELTSSTPNDSKHISVHFLSILTPSIALPLSVQIWSLSSTMWGGVILGLSTGYALIASYLYHKDTLRGLSHTQSIISATLLILGSCLILEEHSLFIALSLEALALHYIGRRLANTPLITVAHFLFSGIALWMAERLSYGITGDTPILHALALTDLLVLGIICLIAMLLLSKTSKWIYLLLTHFALLSWFSRELSSIESGQAYVTIAWGAYAVILLILGLRLNQNALCKVSMLTLLLVVGKLFRVDLAELETLWRIVLFIGFGGLFLTLSYFFRALWKPPSAEPSSTKDA